MSSRCWSRSSIRTRSIFRLPRCRKINEPLEGEFDGIGVVFNMATDTVIVLNVIPQGPSDKAGIKAGDRIIEINDTLVAGQKTSAARRGEETARPARHDSAPRARTPGNHRAGRRRRRTRQDSDQERRIGIPHCRRHRLHQAGTVRTDDLRRDAAVAGLRCGRRAPPN